MTLSPEMQKEMEEMNKQIVDKIHNRDVTRGDLQAAFTKVQNKENWKYPIDTEVTLDNRFEVALVQRAVIFFAGCKADVTKIRRNRYRVQAIGYYEAVGA